MKSPMDEATSSPPLRSSNPQSSPPSSAPPSGGASRSIGRLALGAIGFAAIVAIAGLGAQRVGDYGARLIEDAAESRVRLALAAGGHPWAQVALDGLAATLSGRAPNEARRLAALASARGSLASLAPAARLIDLTEATPPPASFAPKVEISLLRGLGDVAIAGYAPNRRAQAALIAALKVADPNLAVNDLSRFGRDPATAEDAEARPDAEPSVEETAAATGGAPQPSFTWSLGAAAAAEAAAALIHGRVDFSPGAFHVNGLAADDASKEAVEAIAAKLRAAGWRAEALVSAPPTPGDALVFRAKAGPEGADVLECAAPGADAALAIAARATALFDLGGGHGGRAPLCRPVAGADEPRWRDAAAAALEALAALPAGEISLVGRRARLTASPPTRARALAAAREALSASLPEGYALVVLARPAPITDAVDPAYPFGGATAAGVTLEDGALTLSGGAPSALLIDSVVAFARATLPGLDVTSEMVIEPSIPSSGWRAAMTTLVSALGALEGGRARLTREEATLEGATRDPARVSDAHRFLVRALGGDRAVSTAISVRASAQAEEQPLPASRCAAELSAMVEAEPIRFSPGSAEIDPASAPVLARLAAVAPRCVDARIEIGGHTDSQGRESTNLSLSRARAEAVLAALLGLDGRLANLTAVGYGESQPIASNSTETGRAENRRIAFRALTAQEARAAEETAAQAEKEAAAGEEAKE